MFHGALSSQAQADLFKGIEAANHIAIERALNQGADINSKINNLDPLQYAIVQGVEYIVEFLIESGAKIEDHHITQALALKDLFRVNKKAHDIFYNDAEKIAYFASKDKSSDTDPRKIEKCNALILKSKQRNYKELAYILEQEKKRQEKKASQANNQNDDDDETKSSSKQKDYIDRDTLTKEINNNPLFQATHSTAAKSSFDK